MSKRGRLQKAMKKAAERDKKNSAKESRMKNPSGGSEYAKKKNKQAEKNRRAVNERAKAIAKAQKDGTYSYWDFN